MLTPHFAQEEDEICFNWKTHLNKLFSEETLVIKMSNAYVSHLSSIAHSWSSKLTSR